MTNAASSGSPALHRNPTPKANKMEEKTKTTKRDHPQAYESEGLSSVKQPATGFETSSLANQSFPKKMKLSHEPAGNPDSDDSSPMDALLARLSKHQAVLHQQGDAYRSSEDDLTYPSISDHTNNSSSVPITPATDTFDGAGPLARPSSGAKSDLNGETDEVVRLRVELAQAQNKISRMNQELAHAQHPRIIPDTSCAGPPEMPMSGLAADVNTARLPGMSSVARAGSSPVGKDGVTPWAGFEDSRSDTSDALSATGFNRSRHLWAHPKQTQSSFRSAGAPGPDITQITPWSGRGSNHGYGEPAMPFNPAAQEAYRGDRLTPDYDLTIRPTGGRRGNRLENRFGSPAFGAQGAFGSYHHGSAQFDNGPPLPPPLQSSANGAGAYGNYQPQPIGTPLSPLANEFTTGSATVPWKTEGGGSEGPTYVPTTEPLNYRRLLDRNANCNWKYIVDKIVCNNDQQASIFLQQKLKVGTPDQKYEIVEAIIAQAYPLMINRFGNFLVQRCFEHGTPEQVTKIAEAIRGSTLTLSMDPFGCHVVQKAFDSVTEDYKAVMVHELLRRIPETVIHRYACHVWQKLFELRWTNSPPQIMNYVNSALSGMWHEVALGETGSLVVQNIFENCLEDDKRPCIEEVLANIDIVAHGQFGNWCIQHICEHGAPADRSRAVDHVIRFAAEYSMDQYASKVVEKCLKIGGAEFLGRYLDRVCEGRADRPRIPLIDIASDQYGNYLVQWILLNASPQHQENVSAHVRKHIVSLRGSKFGSKVGMMVVNPAYNTRPGPAVGRGMGRLPAAPRYGGRTYQ